MATLEMNSVKDVGLRLWKEHQEDLDLQIKSLNELNEKDRKQIITCQIQIETRNTTRIHLENLRSSLLSKIEIIRKQTPSS